MVSLRNKALFALSLLSLLPFFASADEPPAKSKVTMTVVANEGILVAGSEARLLVDGLFGKSYTIFQAPDADTIAKLTAAAAPFDRLTAALVTHKDTDHVNAAYVSAHLGRDTGCAFVAPAEVVELVRSQPDSSKFEQRIHAIPLVESETETIINKVKIRAIPLRHMPRPPNLPEMPFNVGYLFTVDGITFFHTGDMSAENLAALQSAKLHGAEIDVLLISWYAFKPEEGRLAQAMIQYLHPKVVLLAHLTTKNAPAEKALVEKVGGLPPVIPLDTAMRTYTIEKLGTTVRVE
ncbi:MAG: MBL fold metallo-hydrolase [Nibricoccus sp.]